MNPSREAIELLHDSRRMQQKRQIFAERRRWPRFWRRWWLPLFAVLVFAFHYITRGPL